MSVLFIHRQAPYNNKLSEQAMVAISGCALFGQPVSVLFLNQGVQNVVGPHCNTVFNNLQLYGVEKIYIQKTAASKLDQPKNLITNKLPNCIRFIGDSQISDVINNAQHVISF
jgi:sulfur relay (sulfurtransferase) DsrF/TusC family protein